MSKNELKEHKKRDKIKWIFIAIGFILIAAIIAGMAMQIFGKGKVKPSEWFKKQETEQTQPENNTDSAIITHNVESNGIRLMSAKVATVANSESAQSNSDHTYNLSVEYVPADTTFKETTFTIAWKNPESEWAVGKNIATFATLTQPTEGSTTAVLKILLPFSEQLLITAKNNRNPEVCATTTVDWVCSSLGIYLESTCLEADSDIFISSFKWGGGTVVPESHGHIKFVAKFSDYVVNLFTSQGVPFSEYYYVTLYDEDLPNAQNNALNGGDVGTFDSILRANATAANGGTLPENFDNVIRRYYSSIDGDNSSEVFEYGCIYDRYYNGVDYGGNDLASSDWGGFECYNLQSFYQITPNSMNVNNSSIIAG